MHDNAFDRLAPQEAIDENPTRFSPQEINVRTKKVHRSLSGSGLCGSAIQLPRSAGLTLQDKLG
jgi:hypothetical protein